MIQKEGTTVKVEPPQRVLEAEKRKAIIYKTHNLKDRKMDRMAEETVEKCLQQIWSDIGYITRGKKFGTIDVRMTFFSVVVYVVCDKCLKP
ncbi:Hypothetical predicted protein [Octopus vulgaris]|uniref:Uncharacterized protein n=1 Tax=Octopus vulgaris TaxID=6645 RepID=A0AA36AXT7_OCTVU|nr:Hypothetical predicted protein [Octopus vulgaris]